MPRLCGVAIFAVLALGPASATSMLDGIDKKLGMDAPAADDAAGSNYRADSAALDVAWLDMPLQVQNATFVKQKASGYGVYDARRSNEFAVGETLYFYAEPLGYIWKPIGSGGYTFGLTADLSIQDEAGASLYDKPGFATLQLVSHEKNREFMINFDLALTGLKPGHYKIAVKLHDLNSPKTAAFTLPFKITGRA